MKINSYLEDFTNNGFTKIDNAIDKKLILEISNSILNFLTKKKNNFKNTENTSQEFKKIFSSLKEKNLNLFDNQKDICNYLDNKNFLKKIINGEKVHHKKSKMLGSDLEYLKKNEFIINISKIEKKNYLFKKYHQEVWSGASTNTILIWIPIFQLSTKGQMKLIKNSHLWGHIPHHDKKPIKIPKNSKYVESNCEIGDIILFHSLTLHSSDSLKKAKDVVGRLSMSVRNFKYPQNGLDLDDWKKYSYSPNTIIEKQLGNPYLSPFRLSPKSINKHPLRKYKFK